MIAKPLSEFVDRMIDKGEIMEADVICLSRDICPDGIISRSEADALIALDRLVAVPVCWGEYLVQAIVAFARRQAARSGVLPPDFVNWLTCSLDIGVPTERAVRVAAAVIAETHCVDDYLRRFARNSDLLRDAA